MFTVAQRDAFVEQMLKLAKADDRVAAAAVVGSLAAGTADRFSDVDLTFGIADDVPILDVLGDWTARLVDERDAVHLVDLERGPTIYRVILLRERLQFDLSMTPAARFRPAGPRFRLVFGDTTTERFDAEPSAVGSLFIPTPAAATDVFGWGVIYALHARACIERGRVWQAEHYVGAVRDHALSLACLNRGVPATQARGYDDVPPEILDRSADAHVGSLEPAALRTALAASVDALLEEGREAALPHSDVVADRLAELR